MPNTAVVFEWNSLPEQARTKSKTDVVVDDLHPSQRLQASNADTVAIKDGTEITILAPTGIVGLALESVREYLTGD